MSIHAQKLQHQSENFKIAKVIGNLAEKAMLDEVFTTPKPGLVDCYSNGAHLDMDLSLFCKSAKAITPHMTQMALLGADSVNLNTNLFQKIRKIGIEAEKAMFHATNGVNTHKGMIFSMGVFSTVAGYCFRHNYQLTDSTLFFLEQQLVKETLQEELQQLQSEPVMN
ncbi:MAG: triphosphoribosyl-dephospho-CoA synthase, partial [Lachnospiraceae bacterium]|nr:triphosphoribosyl-dephospho-CoA synthase [Lachnospiraceae bacterium]